MALVVTTPIRSSQPGICARRAIIRMAQSLGMSLKETATISDGHRDGGITRERSIQIVSLQPDRWKNYGFGRDDSYLRATSSPA
jgi:hypothetical protein